MTDRYAPNIGLAARTRFREEVIRDLRNELIHLKSFQITILTFGITGAGVFLGLIKEFGSSPQYYFFLPLGYPFSLLDHFFEKARTIARNIGFIRIQEKLCVSGSPDALLGFETAMRKYWKDKKTRLDTNPKLKEDIEHFIRNTSGTKKTLHASHYWFTTYIVFFIFSFLSIIFSLLQQSAAYTILMTGLCIVPLVFSIALLAVAHYVLDKSIEFQKERGDYLLVFSLIIGVVIILFLLIYAYLLFSGYSLTVQDTGNFDVLYYIVFLTMIGLFSFVSLFTYRFFYNLVKGRYQNTIFERKWCEILELDPVDILYEEKLVMVDKIP
ncbi:MAG: hypothetical protein M0Q91_15355 [Methanoregula sp.]|jgi:hypothetical protein|nr:hypothetical protein [Methanoregula sp.]